MLKSNAGVYISIGFDSHKYEDYDEYKVHEMYDFLKQNNFKMIDELLIQKQMIMPLIVTLAPFEQGAFRNSVFFNGFSNRVIGRIKFYNLILKTLWINFFLHNILFF